MGLELAQESVWFDKWRYDDAEANFYGQKPELSKGIPGPKEILQKGSSHALQPGSLDDNAKPQLSQSQPPLKSNKTSQAATLEKQQCNDPILLNKKATAAPLLGSLATQIARAREDIQNSRSASGRVQSASAPVDVLNRMTKLEGENENLRKTVQSLEKTLAEVTKRLSSLECSCKAISVGVSAAKPTAKPEPMDQDDDDDEEVDLFGSDEEEEDAEAARVREERLKAYADKKSTKPGPIAKSSVLLDCKPWDDETDLKLMEAAVRAIKMDGLIWGAAKAVPLAFGIHKLTILCTVEDEKVSIDELSETITTDLEEYVQSVDIAAFNKI